jgi:hypothetical protein
MMLQHVVHERITARRALWRRPFLTLLGGAIVGVAAFLVWYTVVQPSLHGAQFSRLDPPAPVPATYHAIVEEQIAHGLHLTITEVKAGIRANTSEGIFGVAQAQGLTPDQLNAVEIDALQMASNQMVGMHLWTQQQADTTMQYWRQRGSKALGSDMTSWFQRD